MPELPSTLVPVPLRCCEMRRGAGIRFCGEIASHVRPGTGLRGDLFFCELHALPSDRAIPVGQPFELVRLEIVVELAGVTPGATVARSEAVAAVERALNRMGALVDVASVSSRQVRNVVHPPTRDEIRQSAVPR